MKRIEPKKYRKDDSIFASRQEIFNLKDDDRERRIQAHCARVKTELLDKEKHLKRRGRKPHGRKNN